MRAKLLFIICLMTFGLTYAQGGKMRERIKSQKIAFITDQLQLSSEEAQNFWPIFNKYETEVENIKNGELRSIRNTLRSGERLNDKQANDLINRLTTAESDIHDLRLNLVSDLRSVLSPQKILRLKVADEEFNKRLLERLREMREKRGKKN